MKQSKVESAIEVFCNYASGFLIAWFTYAQLIMNNEWLKNSPFFVTVIFTVISIIRSYFWRRFFNAEVHKFVHNTLDRKSVV